MDSDKHTIVEGLPSAGKSFGTLKTVDKTAKSATILTSRHDLYHQYGEWCDDRNLTFHELGSFYRDCPTANGEHGSEWETKVRRLYNKGVSGKQIHKHDEQLFGGPLPCTTDGACPYSSSWSNFDPDEYDVLIGNYVHAYNPNVVEGRTVVFDEFPENEFIETFDSNTLSSVVNNFLEGRDEIPFDGYSDVLENRDDDDRHDDAIEWFAHNEALDPDTLSVINGEGHTTYEHHSSVKHALGPLMTFALIDGRNLGNGWEHSRLELEVGSGDGRLTDRVAARNRRAKDGHPELHLLRPPKLETANSVLCLDGTPEPDMWRMVVDEGLDCKQVLSNEERREYLTNVLDVRIIQTTNAAKHYASGTYVNAEQDGALFDSIERETGVRPSLISTKAAIECYDEANVLTPIDDVDGMDDCRESDKIGWYGNFKGSNEFANESVGIVSGSTHPGDTRIKKWSALRGESTKHVDDTYGMDYEYTTNFTNSVLTNMREQEVLQAILRFERGGGNGAFVFVNTAAIPNWVPIEDTMSINKTSDGMKKTVVGIYDVDDQSEFTRNEVEDHYCVDLSDSQIKRNLNQLEESGFLRSERRSGRATLWSTNDDFDRTFA